MTGYCVRCRAKQEMLVPTRTLMKNRRRAMIGICTCCGTKISVAGKWDDDLDASQAETDEKSLTASQENG